MPKIPKHLLQFPWYSEHLAWLKSTGIQDVRHDPPPGTKPQKADLSGKSLAGAELQGADLRGGDFERADFTEAFLDDVDFSDACLDSAGFPLTHAHNTLFTRASLCGAVFLGADLERSSFAYADARRAQLGGSKFVDCDFNYADLRDSDLTDSNFAGSDFARADLEGIHRQSPGKKANTCDHKWLYTTTTKGTWVKTCAECWGIQPTENSTGKTADGKPFVILITE